MNQPATRRQSSVSVFQCLSVSGLRPPTSGLRHPRKSSCLLAESASLATRHSPLFTGRRPAAFTLIELLVVIAIIAILAGLGFAGIQGAMESSKRAQARNDVHQIALAVKAYLLEYGRLPATNPIPELIGANPRKIVFLEAKNAKNGKGGLDGGSMKDPWGNTYAIKLDTDYDNRVDGHLTTVVVETTTPDGKKINNVQ